MALYNSRTFSASAPSKLGRIVPTRVAKDTRGNQRLHYSINSLPWVFAYRLPPVVSSLEESAKVRYVVGANC